MLFSKRSMAQLKLTFDTYVQQSRFSNMVDVVESEFSSDIRRALKALVEVATDKYVQPTQPNPFP
jgi:NAD-dependent oxidoreductase involved in siderophore biosynthesis